MCETNAGKVGGFVCRFKGVIVVVTELIELTDRLTD